MIPLWDIEQGSDEWFKEKAGKPGASSFDKIITTKGEPSKTRQDYIFQLAAERIVGREVDGYTNAAMQRGIEQEPEGRALFEFITGLELKQVGLVYMNETRRVLCSPDGLLPDAGFEQKNPTAKTQAKYLFSGKLPTEYFQQVQGSMWVCGFEIYWFMSNYPGMPPLLLEVKRDDKWIAKLETAMSEFLDELDNVHQQILKKAL
jgi:hypothetical protein